VIPRKNLAWDHYIVLDKGMVLEKTMQRSLRGSGVVKNKSSHHVYFWLAGFEIGEGCMVELVPWWFGLSRDKKKYLVFIYKLEDAWNHNIK